MTDARMRSPLVHRAELSADEGRASLRELVFIGKLVLRGDPNSLSDIVKDVCGGELPCEANRATIAEDLRILWLGPDEWMILTEADKETALVEKLRENLDGQHAQLVDVSDYYTVIEVAGHEARAMLMKLTPLDLHRKHFKLNDVAGSNFGHAQATLYQTRTDDDENGPAFGLIIRWSMADYLWCLLADAGREFGLPAQTPEGKVELRP